MLVDKRPVDFQLDTGATCNIIPAYLVDDTTEIIKTDKLLAMYNNTTMNTVGSCKLKLRNPKNNKRYKAEFVVVDYKCTPLLGSIATQQMNLMKVVQENILMIIQPESAHQHNLKSDALLNKDTLLT